MQTIEILEPVVENAVLSLPVALVEKIANGFSVESVTTLVQLPPEESVPESALHEAINRSPEFAGLVQVVVEVLAPQDDSPRSR